MDTLIGKQFNRYCLISRLGQGSFAQVYLAEHVYLKTLVAVKILRILLSDEEIDVFLAESVAWSPDNMLLAAGSQDGTVQIWNMSTKQVVLTYHQQTREIWSVAWSPEGKRVVSGSADGTAKVWWAIGAAA